MPQYIRNWLQPQCVKLELEQGLYVEEFDPEIVRNPEQQRRRLKAEVLGEVVDLFVASNRIGNRDKFLKDLSDRESRASTAIGNHVAIPHVRTKQIKGGDNNRNPVMIFGRSTHGVEFLDNLDHEPVNFIVGIVASAFDDDHEAHIRTYLRFFKWIAQAFRNKNLQLEDKLLSATSQEEIIAILADLPE